MMFASLFLLILAGLANAGMDLIQFRWNNSWAEARAKKQDAWGKFLRQWVSPDAWRNKYRVPAVFRPVFKTWMVWVTDAWHFCQMLMFTAYELLAALWLAPQFTGHQVADLALAVLAMKAVRGGTFELLFLSTIYVPAMSDFWKFIRTVAYTHGHRASQAMLVLGFIGAALCAALIPGVWGDIGAIAFMLVAVFGFVRIMIWSSREKFSGGFGPEDDDT
jgi:hypothetical protein